MSKSLNAAIYETHGIPAEVLRIVDQPWPEPAQDEVVVRMAAAPINPADLNAIEGKYPVRPALPATPGMEGAGVVVELGSAVRNLTVGTQVILPHGLGTWREACAVAAEKLVSVPAGIEPIQAAMLKVNPITAWRMLHDFVSLQPGDWLIQNAANSAAGRCVIQIARDLEVPFTIRPLMLTDVEMADELFFAGTAVEITPIKEVDGRVIGGGNPWLPDDVHWELELVDERRFAGGTVHLHYRTRP